MYPTIVIILVETQRSITDICEISVLNASKFSGPVTSEARAATFGHLSFTVLNSTMDSEAESLRSRASQSEDVQERGLEKVILEINLKESRVSAGS